MALENFNPSTLLQDWTPEKYSPSHNTKTFSESMITAFDISTPDTYTYRAQGETTLATTQKAIAAKRTNGLHNWYHHKDALTLVMAQPTPPEISGYISLFNPSLSLPKALNSFRANAKPGTVRYHIGLHLSEHYLNKATSGLIPSKKPRHHVNPYFDIWAYACEELEWAGPWPNTTYTKTSHHMLPVLYHHFGCVVPSYAALYVLAKLAQPAKPSKEPVRPILDVGSGGGYWSFMLRNFPVEGQMKELDVRAVDNGTSEYRVMWVEDTVRMDGVEYLEKNGNGKGCVLLLVYPQATGDFTAPILKKFEGDAIVVAGTQNANGFTAFQHCIIDDWVEKHLPAFEITLRMPLPSFPGKDEALFVFQRRKT
ncbi:hypothetical protein K458DRAFT_134652 [Lentithecium fluviatile CBS 122367]|uniref:Uncharacterized protein n=1 Tax=Lentithecium fluviatile CBS 122367 TaxID=1168545 RepID=A0A6G1ILK1_9PLEO|nr:hypothetical protein K458DRAFT_134652 [Lentithecium fluviatile CBS 122367]